MSQESESRELDGSVPMASGSIAIALVSLRNMETQLRWQGAQWVIALNFSALTALIYRVLSNPALPELLLLSNSCGVIAVLNFQWHNILRRNGKLIDFWNQKLKEHESVNGIEGGLQLFCSQEYDDLANSKDRLQRRLVNFALGLVYSWAICAIAFVLLAYKIWKGGAS